MSRCHTHGRGAAFTFCNAANVKWGRMWSTQFCNTLLQSVYFLLDGFGINMFTIMFFFSHFIRLSHRSPRRLRDIKTNSSYRAG